MKKYLSPGNLIVTTGGILAFVGMTAYFTDSVNLSVPTFFYGVPIFLIGLGLKTSEIPPVELFDKANQPKFSYFSENDDHMMEFNDQLMNSLRKFLGLNT